MQNKQKILWGVFLITIGVLFLLSNLNLFHFNLFFKGWWTLFIIVPSLISFFSTEDKAGSFLSLSLGVILLLAAQNIISWSYIWKIFVPILIVVIGVKMICNSTKKKQFKAVNAKEYFAIFSGVEDKMLSVTSDFRATSVFGSIDLDLRQAKIEKDIVIEVVSVFGGVNLKLPANVNVKTNGMPIFGGLENKCVDDKTGEYTVYLNYICVFGGVDLI